MEYLLIGTIALLIAMLALLTGFGLGTTLTPIFALFFPIPLAIAATALIHLANYLFQATLVGRYAKLSVVLLFGLPAAISSLIGASLLHYTATLPSLFVHPAWNINITPIRAALGLLTIVSACFTLVPTLANLRIPSKYIPLGGVISGFSGGLVGNQGALRAAFLIKSGLTKRQYIGTCCLCSIIVDITRLLVYGLAMFMGKFEGLHEMSSLIISASVMAFVGSYIGSKLLGKVTFKSLRLAVGFLLVIIGLAIFLGLGIK